MCLGVPVQITRTYGEGLRRRAHVRLGTLTIPDIVLALVPNAKVGDFVLMHTHCALEIINQEQARATIAAFSKFGRLKRYIGPVQSQSMQYLHEFRNGEIAKGIVEDIARHTTRQWTVMDICGGQTWTIERCLSGMLPDSIKIVHGPGCPVCVTPVGIIDKAIEISLLPNVILASFGDMMRVPNSEMESLLTARARGANVDMILSPDKAISLAADNPDKEVVLFAIGFETTAAPIAATVYIAAQLGIKNLSLLTAHVLVPPAMEAILSSPTNQVQGFLAAGHVCTIMGYWQYHDIARRHNVPIVVTGFEPNDILLGLQHCIIQLEEGRHEVENYYTRLVTEEGNTQAQRIMNEVYEVCDATWRGIGLIPNSGMRLSEAYRGFDAELRFGPVSCEGEESTKCIMGDILTGARMPQDCSAFGTQCTPDHPLGPAMVSSEGTCAACHRGRCTKRSL